MIVAYPPGGSTDQTARLLATFLQPELGGNANIVVENRPGAGGDTGFRALATAEPDGYTIGFINTPNVLTIPIERKTRFDWHSYDLLGNVIDDPGNFSVLSDSEIKSLADLAAYAKAHPGEVTVGTSGIGSDDHLAMLAFQRTRRRGDDARAVQGGGGRAHGADRRSHHGRCHEHRRGHGGAGERRADPPTRPDEPAAQRRRAGRAHLQGAGLRYRAQLAARHRRAQGAAGARSASAW